MYCWVLTSNLEPRGSNRPVRVLSLVIRVVRKVIVDTLYQIVKGRKSIQFTTYWWSIKNILEISRYLSFKFQLSVRDARCEVASTNTVASLK